MTNCKLPFTVLLVITGKGQMFFVYWQLQWHVKDHSVHLVPFITQNVARSPGPVMELLPLQCLGL